MREKLLAIMTRPDYRFADGFQLARYLKEKDGRAVQAALLELENDGLIVKTNQGKFGLAEDMGFVRGHLDLKAAGYGFLIVEGRDNDVFIPANRVMNAMDGDYCLVKIRSQKRDTRTEGEIVKIIKRNVEKVIGEYFQGAIFSKNQPSGIIYKVVSKPSGLVDHSYVSAKIIRYSRIGILDCEITEIFGHKDDPGIEIIEVVKRLDIPYDFPDSVLQAAAMVPETILDSDFEGRVDLTNEIIFTIDGDDTKDIDDAISISKLSDGLYELGVHIADVSHYVKPGSPLDKEAYQRGTSVYLADRVIPMLPRALSNGICSLNPEVSRLAISCTMKINKNAEVMDYRIYPSVIRSIQQLTYKEANKVLDGQESIKIKSTIIIDKLKVMRELAEILNRVRMEIGSIDFETIEPKIMFDVDGKVNDIVVRERGVSERIIEEFMLVANQVVATEIERKKLPFIYRIHEEPDAEKLKSLFLLAKELGYIEKIPKRIQHQDLQKLLAAVEDTEYDKVITMLMLRSMAKAKYSERNLGHYGLAFTDYTHFTSPIRRYPDLLVHRMLRSYLFADFDDSVVNEYEKLLPDAAIWTSKTERRSMVAEREIDDMKKAEFMENKIGEEFEAIVASLTRFGMFVELPNTVEGLVHLSTFPEAIEYDEDRMIYLGISSRKVYNIGMKVRVKLIKADRVSGKIDFVLV
ncbi:MAG: ribonuclease R [Bacilli bacterium]|nr:ribonuclease R [Bacilli bacterium]